MVAAATSLGSVHIQGTVHGKTGCRVATGVKGLVSIVVDRDGRFLFVDSNLRKEHVQTVWFRVRGGATGAMTETLPA